MQPGGRKAKLALSGRDEGGNDMPPELWNRMRLKPMGRAVTASMLSLAMALGVTACSNDYTVSYLYMATSQYAAPWADQCLPGGLPVGYASAAG